MKNFDEKRKLTQGKRGMLSLFLIAFLGIQLIFALNVYGQQMITVSGTVTDAQGQPFPGVTVVVKGTTQGTVTNSEGTFSILNVPSNGMLLLSFVGMQSQEIAVNNQSIINVKMKEETIGIEEVVAVAYGTQKKTSMTSSVSTMEGTKVSSIPVTDLSQTIGGRVSGVITKQTVGEPGRDEAAIYIRGVSTTGSSQPLLIVDGIPREFRHLDPNSIESITILKDAAAVAPYGIGGANGVILVTTKRGKSEEAKISYSGYVGFQNPTVLPDYVNGYQYAILRNAAAENVGSSKPYTEEEVQKFKDGSDPDAYPPYYDIWDEIITKNALLHNHSVSIEGGTEKIKYYASGRYQFQNGMWPTTSAENFNMNLNLDAQVTSTTNISINFNGRVGNQQRPPTDNTGQETRRLFEVIGYSHPGIGPVYFSDGSYGSGAATLIFGSGERNIKQTMVFSQVSIEQKIPFISGLTLKGLVAYDPSFSHDKTWTEPLKLSSLDRSQDPPVIVPGIFGITYPTLSEVRSEFSQITYQASFNYNNTFNNHSIGFTGVFEAKDNQSSNLGAGRKRYYLYIDEINMGSSAFSDWTTSGSSSEQRQVGLVYRINYDYKGKYLLESSGRYDGHYYFAPGKRWGFFPSVSAGWRLSEENFLKNKYSWLHNLKIRASVGEVGALAGGGFQYMGSYISSGLSYAINNSGVQALREGSEANPNITWERARKADVGIDLALWDGLFFFEADAFYEKRSNMLVTPDIITPLEYGIGLSQVNEGVMENKGFDLMAGLNYNITKDLNLILNGSVTFARNKLLQVYETASTFENPNRKRTGRPLGTQFGYRSLGYFQEDDFDSEGNLKPEIATQPWGKVYPGDIRYDDVNNDGEININDHVPIGNPSVPGLIYGISPNVSYKNFTLDLFFQGAANVNFYFEREAIWPFWNGMTAYVQNMDYWTPENPNAKHPRITPAPVPNNTQQSSHWMQSVSYLRLKNARFAYDIPPSITQRANIQSAQIFISGHNVITWTGLLDRDPELSHYRGNEYPQQKVISFGLSLTF